MKWNYSAITIIVKVLLLVVTALSTSQSVYAANNLTQKKCAKYLSKLDNIQSQQRQSNTLKSSISLRKKEDLARKNWWNCKNNKIKTTKKYKNKKKTQAKIKYNTKQKLKNTTTQNIPLQPNQHFFSTNSNLSIKGRYSGNKQFEWLMFYQRPKQCARPKTTQVFAYCMEDKSAQQQMFEQQYKNPK